MSYEFLRTEANGDKAFKISLTLFRDIEQSDVEFDQEIEMGIYLDNQKRDRNQLLSVKLLKRQIVRPPGNEECDYYSDKRIEMGYYERTVRLAPYPQGYHIYFVRCCRNIQDNLLLDSDGSPNQGQTYYGFIPNPAIENSSPFFSGIPSPYMCNNDTNTFLNRAIDPDGDSLVYRFVHPFQGGSIGQSTSKPTPPKQLFPTPAELTIPTVDYKTGFHQFAPFGSDGYIHIDETNGLTTLLARKPGSYVIAIEVEEFRNGISLGTVRLDLQILVLNCPPNKKPVGSNDGGKYFEIEAGEELCFKVRGRDPDVPVQSVTVFATGDILTGENGISPPLAKMQTKKAPSNVETEFCWTPSCEQARDQPYKITISVQDDGCPPKYDNYNIEIKVNKFVGSDEIVGPKRVCAATSYEYIYDAKNPKTNSTFWWEVGNGVIIGDNDKENVTINFTGSGQATIRMVEISQYGCAGDTVDHVVDLIPTPDLPIVSGMDTVCLGANNIDYSTTNTPTSFYRWLLPNGSIGASTTSSIKHSWGQLGDYTLSVVETNADGCRSDTGKINVNVRKPSPGLYGSLSLCPNSSGINYIALGHPNSTFNWAVTGGNQVSGGSTSDIVIDWGEEGLGSIVIIETDKWGCISDAISIPIEKTYDLKGVTPQEDTSVCEFDARVPYFVVESTGSVYRWSVSGGSQVAGDSTSTIEINWGAYGPGLVSVQQWSYDQVNNRECISPVVSLNVVIHPNPTADEIDGDFSFCQGEEVRSYQVNGFTGSTYHWTINGSDQDINGQGTNEIRVRWPDHGSFTMSVIELSKDSCLGEPIDTMVIVHPKPISTEIEGEFIHCFPDINQTLYKVSGYTNSTFNWTVTNGSFVASTSDSILVDWNPQGHGDIVVVEISEFGCVGDTLRLPVYINNIELDMEKVSVGFPDNKMLGQWTTVYDKLTSEPFIIEKRAFGVDVSWSTVQTEHQTRFLENNINTDLTPFEYRIKTTDLCGNVQLSDTHRNVLITGAQDPNDFSLGLNFTPYSGWDNGVNRYELHRSANSQKGLSFMQNVSEGEVITIPGNSKDYRQCFRILAFEEAGNNKSSWSNEICFFFSPNVYIPTAFSPKNVDGLNDKFHPVSVAVKDYRVKIFNRWGEIIFETEDQDLGWDGRYKGIDSQSGVYMYIVTFTDFEDQFYQKAGTLQLMR